MSELNENIAQLLHDADHADSGILGASMAMDFDAMRRFRQQRDALIAEANRLDPEHGAPGWGDFHVVG